MIKASHILKRNNTIVIKVLLYHLLQVLVKKRSIHKPFVSFSFDVLKKEDRNKFQSNRIVILPIYLQRKVSNPSIRFLPVRLFLYINLLYFLERAPGGPAFFRNIRRNLVLAEHAPIFCCLFLFP